MNVNVCIIIIIITYKRKKIRREISGYILMFRSNIRAPARVAAFGRVVTHLFRVISQQVRVIMMSHRGDVVRSYGIRAFIFSITSCLSNLRMNELTWPSTQWNSFTEWILIKCGSHLIYYDPLIHCYSRSRSSNDLRGKTVILPSLVTDTHEG